VIKNISSQRKSGFRIREVTLTSRKTHIITTGQIKKFNLDIKKTFQSLLRGVEDWGATWCDELGRDNTNLHAHILFYLSSRCVSKLPASDLIQIGPLEAAFHGTRRVHALGIFYNFVGEDTDNVNSEWGTARIR